MALAAAALVTAIIFYAALAPPLAHALSDSQVAPAGSVAKQQPGIANSNLVKIQDENPAGETGSSDNRTPSVGDTVVVIAPIICILAVAGLSMIVIALASPKRYYCQNWPNQAHRHWGNTD
jgi:hypothetical protein